MTASVVHVTNLTPGSDNASRAYGQEHDLNHLMAASTVHATNLTPGSERNPSRRRRGGVGADHLGLAQESKTCARHDGINHGLHVGLRVYRVRPGGGLYS